ncbi:MAG: c-type cytochrome [Rhizobiales bacterium]|nr:c-type cytochrome [Hyphomicrobiales bacterium]MBI3672072.1 c-type cytochrome [Hyphomicrobiales bacterium]
MIGNRTLTLWLSPIVMLSAVAWPHRLAAQESGSSSGSQQIPGGHTMQQHTMGPGLIMPSMDPVNGRKLFASKGCVVCHSVNGIGGADAASLDEAAMAGMTNPFDFVANMWRGAQPMIELQQKELGGQVEFTGKELGDIIAFLHDDAEQKKFSKTELPANIKAILDRMKEGESDMQQNQNGMSGMTKPASGDSGN